MSHNELTCRKRNSNANAAKKVKEQNQDQHHSFQLKVVDCKNDNSLVLTRPGEPAADDNNSGEVDDIFVEREDSSACENDNSLVLMTRPGEPAADDDNSGEVDDVFVEQEDSYACVVSLSEFVDDDSSVIPAVYSFSDCDNKCHISNKSDVSAIKTSDDNSYSNSLLVDSGASSHICNDESKFKNIDSSFKPQNHCIELADGTKTSNLALKRGDVEVNFKDVNGNVVNGVLKDTLFIPSFPVDIFSVPSATQCGASVIFNKNSSKLITSDGTKFNVDRKGRLFFIDQAKVAKCADGGKKKSLTLWHRIMGHCNKHDLIKLQDSVIGMKINDCKEELLCEVCILGKQKSFRNRKPDERAKECLELVHTDLIGPIEPVARDGFRYAIAFVDDFSSGTFIYFLKNKSDSAKALLKFLADVRPYGSVKKIALDLSPVKRIRSDNGGEFICKEFTNVLLKHRIKHEKSAPYSPHQNGTVERNWHTLFDMARCLLIEAGLPRELWTYAVMTSVYIRNRCYHQRTKETPYYLLSGKKPDLSHMHIFGSICYPYEVKKTTKLSDRSVKGVFLGYDKSSPAYIVYYPDTKKILTHRVVTFTDVIQKNSSGGSVDSNQLQVDLDDDEEFPGVISHSEVNEEVRDDVNPQVVVPDDNLPEVVPERRYPRRERNQPPHLQDYDTNTDSVEYVNDFVDDFANTDFCFRASVSIPKSYKEAISCDEADKWKDAMDEEIESLHDNNTFTLVPLPEDRQVVGGRWVYAVKTDLGGNERFKARYVAQGFKQIQGNDYFETFAPTAKMSSVRMMMQVAAELDLIVHQLDVKTAYLNANLDCEIFMNQPKGYEVNSDVKMVCRLNKAIYIYIG